MTDYDALVSKYGAQTKVDITSRDLIYERLGFGVEAYGPLCEAGAVDVTNALFVKRVTDGFRALVGGNTPLAPEVETLRDRFAGRVLTGMMADHTAPNRPPEFFADLAYKYADAMMEARKK
jgi:hypothetical protein